MNDDDIDWYALSNGLSYVFPDGTRAWTEDDMRFDYITEAGKTITLNTLDSTKIGVCSICHSEYTGYGNSAWPINDGRCCASCAAHVVLPRRIRDAAAIGPTKCPF
jgi:hypothetical protein